MGPSAECPERANNVLQVIREQNFGTLMDPKIFDESKYTRIHAPDYLQFLQDVWQEWQQSAATGPNA